jgi:hypothetical protein
MHKYSGMSILVLVVIRNIGSKSDELNRDIGVSSEMIVVFSPFRPVILLFLVLARLDGCI